MDYKMFTWSVNKAARRDVIRIAEIQPDEMLLLLLLLLLWIKAW